MPLDPSFLTTRLAHRGLHDASNGCPENSRAAVRAALAAHVGVEIDLQLSSDGEAMVFHDNTLDRLTAETGRVDARSAEELGQIGLKQGNEGIPTLQEILQIMDGRQPLLIEIKDQDGTLGPNVGPLETAVARALTTYTGPVAVMSFNPHSVFEMARLAPGHPSRPRHRSPSHPMAGVTSQKRQKPDCATSRITTAPDPAHKPRCT